MLGEKPYLRYAETPTTMMPKRRELPDEHELHIRKFNASYSKLDEDNYMKELLTMNYFDRPVTIVCKPVVRIKHDDLGCVISGSLHRLPERPFRPILTFVQTTMTLMAIGVLDLNQPIDKIPDILAKLRTLDPDSQSHMMQTIRVEGQPLSDLLSLTRKPKYQVDTS